MKRKKLELATEKPMSTKTKVVIVSVAVALLMYAFTTIISAKISNDNEVGSLRNELDTVQIENLRLQNRLSELEAVKTSSKNDIATYIQTYYKTVGPVVAHSIAENIIMASDKHDVPAVAIVAVTEIESHFNPAAHSTKGARGLMQVMPKYWMQELNLKSKYELHGIQTGIDAGTYILRKYLDKTENNMKEALYKYVGGLESYVNDVYKSMGRFVVYRSFANLTVDDNNKEQSHEDRKIAQSTIIIHIVKKGETLSSISKLYSGSIMNWKKIWEINKQIIPEKMPIGIEIIIPSEWSN